MLTGSKSNNTADAWRMFFSIASRGHYNKTLKSKSDLNAGRWTARGLVLPVEFAKAGDDNYLPQGSACLDGQWTVRNDWHSGYQNPPTLYGSNLIVNKKVIMD